MHLHKETGRIALIGSPPAFLLPVYNFFHKNNKSEPMTNRYKVRIILFWWRRVVHKRTYPPQERNLLVVRFSQEVQRQA